MSSDPAADAPYVREEIARQPDAWLRAAGLAPGLADVLPRPGESVAVIGCGTSWFMAAAYAGLREAAGQGETDAFAASELPDRPSLRPGRGHLPVRHHDRGRPRRDRASAHPSLALTAVADTPVAAAATDTVVLDFADERSVVQTVFATTTLMLLRASLGRVGRRRRRRRPRGARRAAPRRPATGLGRADLLPGPALGLRRRPGGRPEAAARRAGSGPSPTRRWSTATGPSPSPSPAGPCG